MKKFYIFYIFITLLTTHLAFSQGANCAARDALWAGGSDLTFPNSTGTAAEAGIDYECLGSQPNPAWFYMQIGVAGTINFQISQATNAGNPIDVDYILWGPFSGPVCGPANLNPTTSVSCSFSHFILIDSPKLKLILSSKNTFPITHPFVLPCMSI